jgi:hypothetical protein
MRPLFALFGTPTLRPPRRSPLRAPLGIFPVFATLYYNSKGGRV